MLPGAPDRGVCSPCHSLGEEEGRRRRTRKRLGRSSHVCTAAAHAAPWRTHRHMGRHKTSARESSFLHVQEAPPCHWKVGKGHGLFFNAVSQCSRAAHAKARAAPCCLAASGHPPAPRPASHCRCSLRPRAPRRRAAAAAPRPRVPSAAARLQARPARTACCGDRVKA